MNLPLHLEQISYTKPEREFINLLLSIKVLEVKTN